MRDDSGESIESVLRSEEEKRLEAGGEAVSVVLRALSCGATYSVRGIAHSRAGSSPVSAPLLVRTKPPGKGLYIQTEYRINTLIRIFQELLTLAGLMMKRFYTWKLI